MAFFRGSVNPTAPSSPSTAASGISYSNTKSGLVAKNVQDAIDELSPSSTVANVQNLVITASSSTSISVSWTPLQGITRYVVDYRGVAPNITPTGAFSTGVFVSGSSFTVSNISSGQFFEIRVRADYGTAGLSSGSSVTGNTQDLVGLPETPTNFRVTDATTTSITVAFDKGVNTTGVKLWIKESLAGQYSATPNATPSGSSYTFPSLTLDTEYTMRIAATNGLSDSTSVEITFKTPSGVLIDPASLTVTSFTSTTAAVVWTSVQGAASYLIDFKPTAATNYSIPIEQTTITSTFLNLSPGVNYTFRVRAKAGTTISTGTTTTQTTLGASTGGGDIVKEAVVTNYNGSGPILVNKPAGSSGESIYIAVAYKDGDSRTLTTPTNYTLVDEVNSATSVGRLVLYKRDLVGVDAAGTVSITVTGGAITASVICLRTKGDLRTTTKTDGGYADVFTAPSVTPAISNSPVFQIVASGQWPRNYTASNDITLLAQTYEPTSGPSIVLGHKVIETVSGTSNYNPIDPTLNTPAGDDFMAISFVLDGSPIQSVLSGSFTTAATQTLNIPAANAGDTLYLGVNFHAATADNRTLATPSGWTLVDTVSGPAGGAPETVGKMYVFRKDVTASVSQATQSVTFSGLITGGVYVSSRQRGAFRTVAKTSGTFTTSMAGPSVTAASDNALLLSYVGTGHSPRTFTAPTGTTELADVAEAITGPAMALGSRVVNTGVSGTTVWTPDTGDDYQAITVLIDNGTTAPPSGGGGGGGSNSSKFEVGSHQHGYGTNDRWPAGTWPASTNTMEPFNFRSFRSHDNEGMNFMPWWTGRTGGINAAGDSLNVYDWSRLFIMSDKFVGRGHNPFLWCVFGNPRWASRRPDDNSDYGQGVTAWVPNASAYRQMVRDTLLQLRGRHGANAVGWVEAWNEPIGGGNNYDSGQFMNAVGFPAGAGDPQTTMLAEISRSVYQGVRDAGTTYSEYLTIPVLLGSHTYTNFNETRQRLFNAKCIDGTPITGLGADCAWSFHPYGFSDDNPFQNLTSLTSQLRQWATEIGTGSWDFYNTEWGTYYPWSPQPKAWWESLSDQAKADVLYNAIGRHKSLGWRGVWTYSSDGAPSPGNTSFIGDPERSAPIRDALNRAFTDFQVS